MSELSTKRTHSQRRAHRVRTAILNTGGRPRLSVHISNLHVSAQIIDDENSKTLASISTVGKKMRGNMSDKAEWIGSEIALQAKKSKVKKVSFDRGHRKYHGRVKKLADAARKGGLEF